MAKPRQRVLEDNKKRLLILTVIVAVSIVRRLSSVLIRCSDLL